MIITESIDINAPLEIIWETFTDLTCWKNWNTVMKNICTDRECINIGNNIKCTFVPFFIPIKVEMSIEEVIPYEKIVWSAQKKGLLASHEFIFNGHDQSVTVTSREIFSGLLSKASGFLLPKKRMKGLTKKFLKELKNASESHSVVRT